MGLFQVRFLGKVGDSSSCTSSRPSWESDGWNNKIDCAFYTSIDVVHNLHGYRDTGRYLNQKSLSQDHFLLCPSLTRPWGQYWSSFSPRSLYVEIIERILCIHVSRSLEMGPAIFYCCRPYWRKEYRLMTVSLDHLFENTKTRLLQHYKCSSRPSSRFVAAEYSWWDPNSRVCHSGTVVE